MLKQNKKIKTFSRFHRFVVMMKYNAISMAGKIINVWTVMTWVCPKRKFFTVSRRERHNDNLA